MSSDFSGMTHCFSIAGRKVDQLIGVERCYHGRSFYCFRERKSIIMLVVTGVNGTFLLPRRIIRAKDQTKCLNALRGGNLFPRRELKPYRMVHPSSVSCTPVYRYSFRLDFVK